MNEFQRYAINKALEWKCYNCDDRTSDLPWEVLLAAQNGNVDEIKDYIAKDHDVNALYEGESLISRAFSEGHVEIVKLLLQCPEIHLNKAFEGNTPLMRAAQNGHMECVRLLLDSSVMCAIQLDKCRKIIVNVLKTQPQLKQKTALHIMRWARYEKYWDVVQLILQTDHQFTQEELYPVIMTAVDRRHWDTIYKFFKKDFYGKNELLSEVFSIAVCLRCWESIEGLLHVMNGELKFELLFVEAALVGRVDEVQRLLTEKQYDAQTLNGSLLVVAAGGTNEPVAELLLTIKNTYTKRTYSDALFLSALRDCAELFICLLSNPETSYSIKELYQAKAFLTYQSKDKIPKGFLMTFLNNYLNKFQEIKIESLIH